MSANTCRKCGNALSAAERRDGRCESCGARLAPRSAEPADEEVPVLELAGPSRGTADPADLLRWGATRAGLGTTLSALVLLLVGLGMAGAGLAWEATMPPRPDRFDDFPGALP